MWGRLELAVGTQRTRSSIALIRLREGLHMSIKLPRRINRLRTKGSLVRCAEGPWLYKLRRNTAEHYLFCRSLKLLPFVGAYDDLSADLRELYRLLCAVYRDFQNGRGMSGDNQQQAAMCSYLTLKAPDFVSVAAGLKCHPFKKRTCAEIF